jgi:hypothetical protein
MKNSLQKLLQEGDPITHEPAMTPDEIEWMRHLVVASEGRTPRTSWSMRVAYASAFAAVIGVSGWLNYETTREAQPTSAANNAGSLPTARSERRQLQFATPGGTRVIWVFDSNFEMR